MIHIFQADDILLDAKWSISGFNLKDLKHTLSIFLFIIHFEPFFVYPWINICSNNVFSGKV